MNFVEFRKFHDHYDAYSDWITVKEAKASGLIPETLASYFPNECECGSENIIKKNLRQIMCCDPKCYQKEACQMAEFLSRSGVERFGDATCLRVLNLFRDYDRRSMKNGNETIFPTGSFLDIFDVPEEKWPFEYGSALERDFAVAVNQLKSDDITFPILVSRLGIASLGSNALKIFDGISRAMEFKRCIDAEGGVRFFCSSRGVYAPEVVNNIYESLIDIANAERLFSKSIRRQGMVTINICITGSSALHGTSLTKADLVQVLNRASIGECGLQYFEFQMCTALQSAPFILYTNPSNSAKFRAGAARGEITDEFGTHPVLMQIDAFFELLQKHVSELDEEVKKHG